MSNTLMGFGAYGDVVATAPDPRFAQMLPTQRIIAPPADTGMLVPPEELPLEVPDATKETPVVPAEPYLPPEEEYYPPEEPYYPPEQAVPITRELPGPPVEPPPEPPSKMDTTKMIGLGLLAAAALLGGYWFFIAKKPKKKV